MEVIIGVDLGTTSTKAIAFTPQGQALASNYRDYPILNPQPAYSEQDPEQVFRAVLSALAATLSQVNQAELAGISFSSAMHGLLAVDATGSPLTNCIIWADNRAQPQAEWLRQHPEGQDIYARTGTPLHPMSPLCKLLWLQAHDPELLRQTHQFISLKEFVFFRLFGCYLTDYSLASATGLFDLKTLTWYAPALALAGIRAGQLPTPVSPLHFETDINPAYARQLGLQRPVPFIIGASDGCLANLGAGVAGPGAAALTIGTSGAIRVTIPDPAPDPHRRLFRYLLTPGRFVVGGPVNNGGVVLRWFRDTFAQIETQEALSRGVDAYDVIIEKAAAAPAGSAGLLFLPYLLGERAPIWDAQARGVFFGIALTHTRAHFCRSVLEGILFGIYQVTRAVEETTGPIGVIYASGGFARSPFWVQLLSDITGKKVRLSQTVEASAWGAALLGREALGLPTADHADADLAEQEFLPDAARHAIYLQNFSIFEKLYPLLREAMIGLQALPGT